MPRDGNGVYTLPTGNPVAEGEIIDPVWANTTLEDIADALTDSLTGEALPGELGTAAFEDTGTSGATIPMLNAGNTWSVSQTFTNGFAAGASSFTGAVTFNAGTSYTIPLLSGTTWNCSGTLTGAVIQADTHFQSDLYRIYASGEVPGSLTSGQFATIKVVEDGGARYLDIGLPTESVDEVGMRMFVDANDLYWVWENDGRLSCPAAAPAATEDYHMIKKADLDTALGVTNSDLATLESTVNDLRTVPAGVTLVGVGTVDGDTGNIIAGSVGFTSTRNAEGDYSITITNPAASAAKVVCMVTPLTASTGHWCVVANPTSGSNVDVLTGTGNSWGPLDCSFFVNIYVID